MIASQVVTILLILIGIFQTHHFKGSIMSKITDFRDSVAAAFARVNQSISGIQTDVTSLKAKIDALQNSPGTLSAEDQAALDDIQSQASALADKVQAIDELTPPEAPADSGGSDNGESL